MNKLLVPVSKSDHVRGREDAPIVLVEYGDFQCPYCAQAYHKIKRLEKAFSDVLFVYRHFPLTQLHQYALSAAMAAEAASLEGKFWPMHDLLFEKQRFLGPGAIAEFAKELKLNLEAFTENQSDENLAHKVETDFKGGVRSGVNGTPGLFLNGEKFEGPLEEAFFERLIAA